MLAHDIHVVDVDASHWRRLLSLLAHPLPTAGARPRRLPVILFLEGDRVLKALRIGEGAIALPSWEGPESLAELREELGASWIAAVEQDALAELIHELESGWRFGEDYVFDILRFLQSARARFGQGIYLHPRPLAGLRLPSYDVWRRLLDFALPDGSCAAFYLFHNGSIWTSLIVGKERGMIDLLTTHEALRPAPPLDDWRRDARAITGAITRQLRPVHLACFAERDVWLEVIASRERGRLSRAAAEGAVLIDPAPPWLRAVLSAGRLMERVSREVEKRAGVLGGIFERGAALGGVFGGMLGRAAGAVGLSPERLDPAREALARSLGFDPLAPDSPLRFLSTLLRRESESPQPPGPDRE